MRAAIYLRVSSQKQTGKDHVSMETQEKKARAFVKDQRYELVEFILDPAKSGKDVSRPQYQRLMGLVRRREVDVVVVYKVDRMGRELAESFTLMRRLKVYGVVLESATELNGSPITTQLLMVLANAESDRIRERTIDNQLERLQSGGWVGSAPFGYYIVPREAGGKRLLPDGDNARTVTLLYDLYATGNYGLRSLWHEAIRRGLHVVSRSNLSNILKNPAYTGKLVFGRRHKNGDEEGGLHVNMQSRDKWTVIDGEFHLPLVKQETFDKVQAILANNQVKGDPKPRRRQLLIGVGWCVCGSRLVSHNNSAEFPSYVCRARRETASCGQPFSSVRVVDPVVKDFVRAALAPYADRKLRARARTRLERQAEEDVDQSQVQRASHKAAHLRLTNLRHANYEKLLEGLVSQELHDEAERRFATRIEALERELADIAEAPARPDPDLALQVAAANIDWAALDEEGWRELLAATVERVTLTQRHPHVTLLPAVQRYVEALAAEAAEMVAIRV